MSEISSTIKIYQMMNHLRRILDHYGKSSFEIQQIYQFQQNIQFSDITDTIIIDQIAVRKDIIPLLKAYIYLSLTQTQLSNLQKPTQPKPNLKSNLKPKLEFNLINSIKSILKRIQNFKFIGRNIVLQITTTNFQQYISQELTKRLQNISLKKLWECKQKQSLQNQTNEIFNLVHKIISLQELISTLFHQISEVFQKIKSQYQTSYQQNSLYIIKQGHAKSQLAQQLLKYQLNKNSQKQVKQIKPVTSAKKQHISSKDKHLIEIRAKNTQKQKQLYSANFCCFKI